jgi:hypothetical protein
MPLASDGAMIRRQVAEVAARIDLPLALGLLADLADAKARHLSLGKIAYRVAALHPEKAERVLDSIDDKYRRGFATPRVCYRMAKVDAERARRVARRVTSPYLRALSLGSTARGLVTIDARHAREMLEEAFDILSTLVEGDERRFYGPQSAAVAAAVLLPVAEAIDPQLLPQYLWRTISFRRSYSRDDYDDLLAETATVALLVAQYDRGIARLVVDPVIDRLKHGAVDEMTVAARAAIDAACAIDPQLAASLVEPEPSDRDVVRRFLRYEFARSLAIRPSARTRLRLGDYLYFAYWLPGAPDNDLQLEF